MDARTKLTTVTITDRSKAAFLKAHRFQMKYVGTAGHIDFSFQWSPELDKAINDYNCNRTVLVQDFLTAQREISDAIRNSRQQWSRG